MPKHRRPVVTDPIELIAAALDDWWITTDPLSEFHAPAVAHHLDEYLAHHGYTVTRTARAAAVPTRANIATALFISFLAGLAAAIAIRLGLWVWAAVGAVVAVLTAHEAVVDFTTRFTARRSQR